LKISSPSKFTNDVGTNHCGGNSVNTSKKISTQRAVDNRKTLKCIISQPIEMIKDEMKKQYQNNAVRKIQYKQRVWKRVR
jgi:hypothetical protein